MELFQLNLLIDSGVPIVNVTTSARERMTVLEWIYRNCAEPENISVYLWNSGWGCFEQVNYNSEGQIIFSAINTSRLCNSKTDIFAAFEFLMNTQTQGIFIFENLLSLANTESKLSGLFSHKLTSQIVNIYYELENNDVFKKIIILTTDNVEMPESLASLIPTLFNPLPSSLDIADLLQNNLPNFVSQIDISTLVNAVSGLTIEEIRLGLAIANRSCEQSNINDLSKHLLAYKINRFRSFNLNFVSKPSVPDFGGLDLFKKFVLQAKHDFLIQARFANIPLPKGCLLVGPPGTGKTLAANVCALILGFPLVSVDTAAVVSGGATYLKRTLERVEACAPVVLYFDELDKLFFTSTNDGSGINSTEILGTLLTWLQDKNTPVFVVATLNRLDALPPELTRMGRFDEIFYVGFPQAYERKEILMMHLASFDRRYQDSNVLTQKEWRIILNKTVNCTGAELARMVEKAARKLFHQGLKMNIGLAELLEQREIMVPLYVRDTDRILAIANRAKYFAQPASSEDTSEFAPVLTSFWGDTQ
ncbi:MAG: AAA family ATPase [Richelia sp. SL_2_1]|nr:AAA family ATPase [Richelia sp. SM1_7_0]NJN13398.1 AAA family ATPase [Richelia sp. RM1_1_1]NJO31461.1 AAA family ATPase [Richelia sp. SL_2_1]